VVFELVGDLGVDDLGERRQVARRLVGEPPRITTACRLTLSRAAISASSPDATTTSS
jgi:hypothetical protein